MNGRWHLKAVAAFILAAAAAGLLGGCGGGGNSEANVGAPSTTRPVTTQSKPAGPTKHELAQTYLRIVSRANTVTATFSEAGSRWNDSTTNEQMVRDSTPVIDAWQKADNDLLRVEWPEAIAEDVKAMVRADGAFIGDLRGLETVNALSAGDWTNQFLKDAGAATAAANIVRADLGLPPAKS